jgi:D-amino-acid dehydrogenase
MRTVIVGGGLIGLTTAQALAERGEEVLVLEAREGVGLETSFANGGMLTPSMPEPWNGPGVFGHLLTSLFNPHAAMKLRLSAVPSLMTWGIGFIRNSSMHRYLSASLNNYRMSCYSIQKTLDISRRLGLSYDFSEQGTLCIFEDPGRMEERRNLCKYLEDFGLSAEELDAEQVIAREPVLGPIRNRLIGGIWLPDDARGDAHLFCRALESVIVAEGGEIRTGTSVSGIATKGGKVCGVEIGNQFLEAERVVVAAGPHSPALLATAGQSIAVKPAKGYSITFDGSGLDRLPDVAIGDDALHAVITTFGKRLRVVGTAEFTGFDKSLTKERIDNLFHVLDTVLPEQSAALDRSQASAWAGLRPMSNDGKPFIGVSAVGGLFVNTGHGALGWTMAMGSANLLADQMCGTVPEIDGKPFDARR